jgi:hypothetical protein
MLNSLDLVLLPSDYQNIRFLTRSVSGSTYNTTPTNSQLSKRPDGSSPWALSPAYVPNISIAVASSRWLTAAHNLEAQHVGQVTCRRCMASVTERQAAGDTRYSNICSTTHSACGAAGLAGQTSVPDAGWCKTSEQSTNNWTHVLLGGYGLRHALEW